MPTSSATLDGSAAARGRNPSRTKTAAPAPSAAKIRARTKAGVDRAVGSDLLLASSMHLVLAGRLRHPANGRLLELIRAAMQTVAPGEDLNGPPAASSEPVELIGHAGDLCAQSTVIACKLRRSEEVRALT